MHAYAEWVRDFPFSSAFVQFAILGTLGELLPGWLRTRKLLTCTRTQLLGKILGWGLLGLLIKLGFLMMKGAAAAVIDHGLLPDSFRQGLGWALLGLLIKLGFLMMKGAAAAVIDHGLLPDSFRQGLGWALTVSVLTNLFFGPQMMFGHRLWDNVILRQRHWAGLEKAWWTLLWFWIPAHTVTFALPPDFQIGLAAAWSVVLGAILGSTNRKAR